jgi:pyruvate, orthophosphate dikinase
MSNQRFTYFFGQNQQQKNLTEGDASMKNLLGGKGANLAEMAKLGFPVPPGFTITTEVCTHFYANQKKYPAELKTEVESSIKRLEECMGLNFGSNETPLLVSVRSGARASMPGMMDTILNLGLNDQSVEGLAQSSGNPRFAYDCYRRFIQMYADVVMGVHTSHFESVLESLKEKRTLQKDSDINAEDLKKLCSIYKDLIFESCGKAFPQNPSDQLWGAIGAVFESWNAPRAIHYRKMEQIPAEWGTAVNVQAMVYGNLSDKSGTGVCFSRNPSTGENFFYGEYLTNAQGEDVVAGIRTPHPISKAEGQKAKLLSLEEEMPKVYSELSDLRAKLETHYRDMQDIEFTIQEGRLFLLQTRRGKRTAQAAVRIAVDMAAEKLITENEAVLRVDPYSLDQLLHPRLDPDKKGTPLARGLPASPGAVNGEVVFSSQRAADLAAKGKRVILVRHETSPEDIVGMDASVGILTALGGMTSHAAVVARGMGKSCVAGCAELKIDYSASSFSVNKNGERIVIREGDIITLDANTGDIFLGEIPTLSSELNEDFTSLMVWADKVRRLKIRANADTPHDARTARRFGAEGIGLCRTEHMFFEEDRIDYVRLMIVASDLSERQKALSKLLPMQREDFVGLFKEMRGLPVTIRLLDPPLHEFLPKSDADYERLSKLSNRKISNLKEIAESLHEFNPMLGHRGCRLGITFPEIYEMQVQAIGEALAEVFSAKAGELVEAEIMIPLILDKSELAILRERCEVILDRANLAPEQRQLIKIGTMIEIPRAALLANEVAEVADFFSFGTNDLTQMCMGLSRDDAGKFLPEYVDRKIFAGDPFVSIDQSGVGQLVEMGTQKGRQTKAQLKIGVCGEHGGDPKSVYFFHKVGLDYVSCSPYRVPAARLAAAHAVLNS